MRTGVMVEGNLFESVLRLNGEKCLPKRQAQVSPQGFQGKPREKKV